MEVTFIHAADLHLGTPFKGVGDVSPWLRERLIQAGFQALDRLVALARESDLLLLTGDLLEVDYPHLRAQLELVRALDILAREGVAVFMVAGNHDPYPLWQGVALPKGVRLFSPQGGVEDLALGGGRVSVSGVSHGDRRVRENLVRRLVPGGGDLRLALVHAYLQGQEGHDPYAPCSLGDLLDRDFHYWALGHIHKRQVVMEEPWVVYPGNVQGRHPGEEGERGCFRGRWDGGSVKLEFCPLSPVVWKTREVSLEGVEDTKALLDLLEGLKEEVRGAGGTLLRVVLKGTSPLHSLAREDLVQVAEVLNRGEEREDFVWVTLVDRLSRPPDLDELAGREEFLARLVEEARTLEEGLEELVAEGTLSLLWKRKDLARYLGKLSPEEGKALVEKALRRALSLMLEGE